MVWFDLLIFNVELLEKHLCFFMIFFESVDSFLNVDGIIDLRSSNGWQNKTFLGVTICDNRFEVDRRWEEASAMLLFDRAIIFYKWISALDGRDQRFGNRLHEFYGLEHLIHFPQSFSNDFLNLFSLIIEYIKIFFDSFLSNFIGCIKHMLNLDELLTGLQ